MSDGKIKEVKIMRKTYYGFSNFCSEFGYDEDSRKAYKIFKACKKSLKKAEKIGIDENMACDIMNDLQENYDC